MWLFMMAKGEEIEPFLFRLQAIRDQLTAMGVKVADDVMVRTALNVVTEEWETFVQSILGRADLPNWDSMWVILRQEELCRFTKRQHRNGSNKVKKKKRQTWHQRGSKGGRSKIYPRLSVSSATN